MKSKKCFVDLDGVIVDLTTAIGRALNVDTSIWGKKGVYEFSQAFNIDDKLVMKTMCNNVDFWANLKPYPYYLELIDFLESKFGRKNVFILTKPIVYPQPDSDCWKGKVMWVEKYLPNYSSNDRLLIGGSKFCCANKDSVLIDDSDNNIKLFLE